MAVERVTRRTREVVDRIHEELYSAGIYMPKSRIIEYIILHYADNALERLKEAKGSQATTPGEPEAKPPTGGDTGGGGP